MEFVYFQEKAESLANTRVEAWLPKAWFNWDAIYTFVAFLGDRQGTWLLVRRAGL